MEAGTVPRGDVEAGSPPDAFAAVLGRGERPAGTSRFLIYRSSIDTTPPQEVSAARYAGWSLFVTATLVFVVLSALALVDVLLRRIGAGETSEDRSPG